MSSRSSTPAAAASLLRTLAGPLAPADRPPQALITTTDWTPFDPGFLSGVSRFEVDEGELRAL